MPDAASSKTPIADACHAFLDGSLDPTTPEGLRRLLSGEGEKRTESFVFELLFDRLLGHIGCNTASRWMRGMLPDKRGYLWIVTETADGLNDCDRQFIRFLHQTGQQTVRVRWNDEGPASACSSLDDGWCDWGDFGDVLTSIYGAPEQHQEMKHVAGPGSLARTVFELGSRMTGFEAIGLARQRVLINHYIRRWSKCQPIDIDAIVLNSVGTLITIEFKRKYPSRSGHLSLDTSHTEGAEWLSNNGLSLTYVVLIDPRHDASGSALELLEPENRKRALWTAVDVNENVFSDTLHTTGRNSGMQGGCDVTPVFSSSWS